MLQAGEVGHLCVCGPECHAGLFSKMADAGTRCVNQAVLQEEHLIEALSRACRADLQQQLNHSWDGSEPAFTDD